ncbi:AAA family ATPase [Ideonella sp. DXS29W]|uniref:AAA family ATPase n=1 Tax=Ideonella lacteola TaxID=2984193 RepID=A0ABU9BZ39_9BURK
MSIQTWLDDNNRYLAASLRWLRLKLMAAAEPARPAADAVPLPAVAPAPAVKAPPPTRAWFSRNDAPAALPSFAPTPVPAEPIAPAVSPAELAAAAAERADAASCEPPPALVLLARRMGLSDFEADILLLCAACELDPDVGSLITRAQAGAGGGHGLPNFSLALRLFDEPSWDALSPHRPLRYARLLDINQPGATPLTVAALRADERIVHFIKGLNDIDERLASLMNAVDVGAAPQLSASQQAVVHDLLQQLRALGTQAPALVMLLGLDGHSKTETARAVCAELGCYLYRLPAESLPGTRAEIEQLARLWQRERAMLPLALYLEAEDLDPSHGEAGSLLRSFVSRDLGLVFLALREPAALRAPETLMVEVDKPTPSEQHEAWMRALQPALAPSEARDTADRLASQYQLNTREIAQALALANARTPIDEEGPADTTQAALPERVWKACKQAALPRLNLLAQRIDARATWDDIVLGDEATQLLRQIAAQVRHRYRVYQDWGYGRKMNRGLGISALFCGESGTGKTMAAEVIANELDLALYRIDLSAVVSKYIGETEKNLRRLFDAAETGGAILFFDEADALFGKRSEVKDSHDRYANIEINYLLQRMESFSGLAILATNMRSALDTAFLRRLRFVVNFQYPGVNERRQLWRHAVLPDVPHDELDFDRLARFNLSGGNVTSVALNAAFTAAQRNVPLTMPVLLSSLRAELRKLDKPVNEAEFR